MSTGMLPFPVAVDPSTPISFTTGKLKPLLNRYHLFYFSSISSSAKKVFFLNHIFTLNRLVKIQNTAKLY